MKKLTFLFSPLVLLLLLVMTTIAPVSAKVASGAIELSEGLYQAEDVFNPLMHRGKTGFSTTGPPDSSLVTKGLAHVPKTKFFKGDEAVKHFEKHGSELMGAFGRKSYNLKDYLSDANHVIKNGTFVPEMNGYVRLIGGKGSAKYGFVGLDRATGNITTFHTKSVSKLARKAPSLGFSK